jgi:hypothetical protein
VQDLAVKITDRPPEWSEGTSIVVASENDKWPTVIKAAGITQIEIYSTIEVSVEIP